MQWFKLLFLDNIDFYIDYVVDFLLIKLLILYGVLWVTKKQKSC